MSEDSDSVSEEERSLFRPFTRESLAAIEARIAEEHAKQKELEKKRAEGEVRSSTLRSSCTRSVASLDSKRIVANESLFSFPFVLSSLYFYNRILHHRLRNDPFTLLLSFTLVFDDLIDEQFSRASLRSFAFCGKKGFDDFADVETNVHSHSAVAFVFRRDA